MCCELNKIHLTANKFQKACILSTCKPVAFRMERATCFGGLGGKQVSFHCVCMPDIELHQHYCIM